MEGRPHTQALIPSLSYRVWSKDTGCPSHTTLPAVRKCESHSPFLTPVISCVNTHSCEVMILCWKMSPEDRPTFKEICCSVSKFIERIAGYLEIGFNPFTGGGAVEGGGEEEGENEEGEGKDKIETEKGGNKEEASVTIKATVPSVESIKDI